MKCMCSLAEAGDACAPSAVEWQGYYLGLGSANLVTVLWLDMIALGGGVTESSLLFLDRARQVIQPFCRFVPFQRAQVVLASLGADTALADVAQFWHHRFGGRAYAI